jgi:hypothetical protein
VKTFRETRAAKHAESVPDETLIDVPFHRHPIPINPPHSS